MTITCLFQYALFSTGLAVWKKDGKTLSNGVDGYSLSLQITSSRSSYRAVLSKTVSGSDSGIYTIQAHPDSRNPASNTVSVAIGVQGKNQRKIILKNLITQS